MLRRLLTITVGVLFGLGIGGLWLAVAAAHAGLLQGPTCPEGWDRTSTSPVQGATEILSCSKDEGGRERRTVASLFRTRGPASGVAAAAVQSALRETGVISTALRDAPERSAAEGGLTVLSHAVETEDLDLQAQVYLLAAGRRFGLLTVVHVYRATFAGEREVAEWLVTVGGLSPWGSANAGPITARCPEGFSALPPAGARSVVRCSYGAGSSQFVTLSLSWDEGGFGPDEDRPRVANALAERVARAQGARARILSGPSPFTTARGVDAIRTVVETGEKVPRSIRAVAVLAPGGAPDVLGLGRSEPDVDVVPVLRQMLDAGGHLQRPIAALSLPVAAVGAALLALLGGLAGAAVARRRTPRTTSEA